MPGHMSARVPHLSASLPCDKYRSTLGDSHENTSDSAYSLLELAPVSLCLCVGHCVSVSGCVSVSVCVCYCVWGWGGDYEVCER